MKKSIKRLTKLSIASLIMASPLMVRAAAAPIVRSCYFKDPNLTVSNSPLLRLTKNALKSIDLVNPDGTPLNIPQPPDLGLYGSFARSTFNLSSEDSIANLEKQVDALLAKAAAHTAKKKAAKAAGQKLQEDPNAMELGGDVVYGLEEIKNLISVVQSLNQSPLSKEYQDVCLDIVKSHIAEIMNAVNSDVTQPIVSDTTIVEQVMTGWLSHINHPGQNPGKIADNIDVKRSKDLGFVDPEDSPMWQSKDVSKQDTYIGYGRKSMIDLSEAKIKYDAPKTGYGTRPGIKVKATMPDGSVQDVKIRIMIEAHTGPFLSRLGNAVGFSTYNVDYVKELKMKFNLKFFTEYHSRSQFGEVVHAGLDSQGNEIKQKKNRQRIWNPFDAVVSVTTKNGEEISGDKFKELAYKAPGVSPDELNNKSNYNEAFLDTLESLTIGPVSVEILNPKEHSVGSWGWNGLGHSDLREARGFTLLAAWLSLHDVRKENTRMIIKEDNDGKRELELRISDWGSGLGISLGHFLGFKNELPNLMPDNFLSVKMDPKLGKLAVVTNFRPNQPSLASDKMTYDDARWMARKIGKLTKQQILSALLAGGYSSPEIIIYSDRLIARRNQMVKVLGLESELGLINHQTTMEFAPGKTLKIDVVGGKQLDAESVSYYSIKGGKLIDSRPVSASKLADEMSEDTGILEKLSEKTKMEIISSVLRGTPVGELKSLDFFFGILGSKLPKNPEGQKMALKLKGDVFTVFLVASGLDIVKNQNFETAKKFNILYEALSPVEKKAIKAEIIANFEAKLDAMKDSFEARVIEGIRTATRPILVLLGK